MGMFAGEALGGHSSMNTVLVVAGAAATAAALVAAGVAAGMTWWGGAGSRSGLESTRFQKFNLT